ncbi:hypothetical protein FS749_014901 [Ceratobasidium sp. UAMH 11750]|nr:hypothetical protein FS749_014901 [Ceratobasidium sp. UAMH 11750]
MDLASEYQKHLSGLFDAASLVNEYETYGPPHIWDRRHSGRPPICLLPNEGLSDDMILPFIEQRLPDTFFNPDDDKHHMCSPQRLQTDLMCAPFLDTPTKVQKGGPAGIRLAIILVLRVLHTLSTPRPSTIPPLPDHALDHAPVLSYLGTTVRRLKSQIESSIAVLKATSEARSIAIFQNLEYQSLGDVATSRQAANLDPPVTPQITNEDLPKTHTLPVPSTARSRSKTPSAARNKRSVDALKSKPIVAQYESSEPAASQNVVPDPASSPPVEPSSKRLRVAPGHADDNDPETAGAPPLVSRRRPPVKSVQSSQRDESPPPVPRGVAISTKSPFTATGVSSARIVNQSAEFIDIDKELAKEQIDIDDEDDEPVPPQKEKKKTSKKKAPKSKGKRAAPSTKRSTSRAGSVRATSQAPSIAASQKGDDEPLDIEDDSSIEENQPSFQVPPKRNNLLTSLGLQPVTMSTAASDSAGLGLRSVRTPGPGSQASASTSRTSSRARKGTRGA